MNEKLVKKYKNLSKIYSTKLKNFNLSKFYDEIPLCNFTTEGYFGDPTISSKKKRDNINK